MKLLIIFALVFLTIAQNNTYPPPRCDPTYYGNRDETCDGKLRRCKWFYICKSGKCTYGNIGAACATKSDCFGAEEENLRCVNSKCTKAKYPGYECSVDQECWGGTCVKGICSGKRSGEVCDPAKPVECEYGQYCSLAQKKCVPQLRLLDLCNDYVAQPDIPQGANYNIMCPGGSVCMGRNDQQTCRPYRGGDIGVGCNWQRDGDEACKFGLVCSRSRGICVVPMVDSPTFACTGSSRNCSRPAGETCVCDGGNTANGVCRTRTDRVKCDMISAMNEYNKCSAESNCAYEKNFLFSWLTDVLDRKTCLGYYCGDIAKKYLCCALPAYRREKWSQASSGVLGCPESAGSGVGIAFLVLFLFCCCGLCLTGIIAGIVFVIKKRQQAQFEPIY